MVTWFEGSNPSLSAILWGVTQVWLRGSFRKRIGRKLQKFKSSTPRHLEGIRLDEELLLKSSNT